MSTYAEQPFTEFEERYFLAEILKRSSLPPAYLLSIIRDAAVEPAWNDIALPNGRSVSACQQAYAALQSRTSVPPHSVMDPSRRLKRPFSSMGDATTNLPRELQPRPPTFASVNGQQVPIPPPAVMSPVEPQRKKRGRPTKSEFERRQQEARERGEIWPKPRKTKARPSTESSEGSAGAVGAQPITGSGTGGLRGAIAATGGPQSLMPLSGVPSIPPMFPSNAPTSSVQGSQPSPLSVLDQPAEPRVPELSSAQMLSTVSKEPKSSVASGQAQRPAPLTDFQSQQNPAEGNSGAVTLSTQQSHSFQSHKVEEGKPGQH